MPPVVAVVAAVIANVSAFTGLSVALVTSIFASVTLMGAQMAIGAVTSLFRHPASTKSNNASSQLLTREPISFRRLIYGKVRVSGILTDIFIDNLSASVNVQLHMVITVAGHKVHNIDNTVIYIDGVAVPLTLGGDGAYHPSVGSKYAAHMYVEYSHGDPAVSTQPFPLLQTDSPAHWTVNHLQRGCAAVHVRLLWDANIFANGMPSSIAFDVQGKEVYDPRTGLTAYSNNPALCVRDYLTDTSFGFGANSADIDDASVIAAANLCDELVTKKDATTQTRFACDGAVTSDVPRGDILNQLLASMAGWIIPPGNAWRIFGGAYTTPVLSFTDSDLRGPIKFDALVSRRDLCNGVKGTYVSPANNWQLSDFTPYVNATYVTEDGGNIIWNDITLDFTTDDTRAQRLSKIQVEMSRRQNNIILPLGLAAFPVEPGDTIEFSHPRFGWVNKQFRAVHTSLAMSGQADKPVLGCDVTCVPIDSSVYSWNPATDENTPIAGTSTTLPDLGTVSTPTGLALSNVEVTRTDGIKHLQILAQWTQHPDYFVQFGGKMEVWIQTHAASAWRLAGTADGADTAFYISSNVDDGTSYDVKIRAINSHKVASDYQEVDSFVASATAATFAGTVSSLDNVNDGVSYARPIISRISGGKPLIDFAEGIHLNKQLDNVADGATYGRPLLTRLSTGKPLIDFAEAIHLNKTIDNVGDGGVYIRSTQLIGDAVLDNGNFEASSNLPPAGYEYYANVPTLAYDTATPFSGTQSIKITSPSAGGGGIRPIKHILCRPGDIIYASAQAKWISGAGVADLSISFRDVTGAGLSGADATTGSSSWTHLTASATAPAGTAFVTLEVFASVANTVVEFDEHYVRMVRNLDTEVTDGFSRFAQTAGGLTYRPTSNPLSATDAGSNATVSIAAFTMRCTGHSDVSVSSGSITALSYGTLYYIYYDDATLAGGAVTFNATTTKETAINGSGRFFVGSITTPVASGAATTGNNDGGVGAQGGGTSVFLFGASANTNGAPTAYTQTNIPNCFDGNTSTFGKIVKGALSANASATVTLSGMSPTSAPWQSLTLKVKSAVPTMGIGVTAVLSYSLDNGVTFTNIYSVGGAGGTRAITVDSVALPITQNLALVRVKISLSDGGNVAAAEIDLYEAWVVGVE